MILLSLILMNLCKAILRNRIRKRIRKWIPKWIPIIYNPYKHV